MPETYLISDLHLQHQNVVKYCPWSRGHFQSVEEMNESIVDMWNSTVNPQDTVHFLGDFAMKFNIVLEFLPRLKGQICWISGNHDASFRQSHKPQKADQPIARMLSCNPNLKEVVMQKTLQVGNYKLLLNHFPWAGDKDEHSDEHNQYEDRFKEHRPRREDFPKHFLAHGHVHSSPDKRLGRNSLDCGYDAWGRMVSLEEVLEIARSM